jgi:hypothetical protein
LTPEDPIGEEATLAALAACEASGETAWLTRVHRELARRWDGDYVFRFGERLQQLSRWLGSVGAEEIQERLLTQLSFEDDLDGVEVSPEGGWLSFRWEGRRYRTLSLRARGDRWNQTHTWVGCPDQAAGERLVDAVGRHARARQEPVMVFEDGDWEEAPRLGRSLADYTWDAIVLPEATRTRLRGTAERFFGSSCSDRRAPARHWSPRSSPPAARCRFSTCAV